MGGEKWFSPYKLFSLIYSPWENCKGGFSLFSKLFIHFFFLLITCCVFFLTRLRRGLYLYILKPFELNSQIGFKTRLFSFFNFPIYSLIFIIYGLNFFLIKLNFKHFLYKLFILLLLFFNFLFYCLLNFVIVLLCLYID